MEEEIEIIVLDKPKEKGMILYLDHYDEGLFLTDKQVVHLVNILKNKLNEREGDA